jgi:hypothetical protein
MSSWWDKFASFLKPSPKNCENKRIKEKILHDKNVKEEDERHKAEEKNIADDCNANDPNVNANNTVMNVNPNNTVMNVNPNNTNPPNNPEMKPMMSGGRKKSKKSRRNKKKKTKRTR